MINNKGYSTEPQRFLWRERPDGIEFFLESNSTIIPYNEWKSFIIEYEIRSQWLLLDELITNGQAVIEDNFVLLPNDTLFYLSADDLLMLDLPEVYPFDIVIESKGKALNQKDFQYIVSYCDIDGNFFAKRVGCIIRLSQSACYRLTKEQYHLLDVIDTFNNKSPEDKAYINNLIVFSEIKGLAEETGALLDRYLNSNDVLFPKKISLRVNRIGENKLEIAPEITGLDIQTNKDFLIKFDKHHQPESVYNLQREGSKRIRVVISDEQKEALKSIKKYRIVNKQKAEEIQKCPHNFFDPEVFDLDPTTNNLSFSDRIKEIGFYKPKSYPFIYSYKSKWLPGVVFESSDGRKKQFKIQSKKDIKEIEKLINEARKKGEDSINWCGTEVEINNILPHIEFIKQQTEKPDLPQGNIQSNGEPVLIIKENIDKIEYDPLMPKLKDFKHNYEHPPDLVNQYKILDHQEEGIAWLQELFRREQKGCLLADDMGLGKTLQVLSFIVWHNKNFRLKSNIKKPYLIVAPVTLLENWQAEYNKFFQSSMSLITLYGKELTKYKIFYDGDKPVPLNIPGSDYITEIRKKRGVINFKAISNADIVLTTYETVRDFQIDLCQIQWSTIIIDEAQKIKTPGSLVTNAIKALKTDFSIACTGTPVENSLLDLWCITDFLLPGYLGSAKEFSKEFQEPLRSNPDAAHEIGERVRKRLGVYIKRRLKKDILKDLPHKEIHYLKADMPPIQLERYIEEIKAIQDMVSEKTDRDKKWMMPFLKTLKCISAHPFLPNIRINQDLDEFIHQSAKLTKTVEILEDIKKNEEKVIIFSEIRNICSMLKDVVSMKFNLEEVFIVNGDMPGSKQTENSMKISRQDAINKFECKNGFNVIILSPLAAGVGLNITKANHVIHFSRWWNPAKESQANDRVYRIGQELPVNIYIPMAIASSNGFKTFDEILNDLLEKKKAIIENTLFPTEQAEVTPHELAHSIVENIPEIFGSAGKRVTVEDIDIMDPFNFEALVGVIFQRSGKKVILTPEQNDKGVDVVVISEKDESHGLLIQVKHSSNRKKIGSDAIKEVYSAKRYFEKKFNKIFDCCVVTNAVFGSESINLASINNVTLLHRSWVEENILHENIFWADVRKLSFQRLEKI